jgi:hypothetical protein
LIRAQTSTTTWERLQEISSVAENVIGFYTTSQEKVEVSARSWFSFAEIMSYTLAYPSDVGVYLDAQVLQSREKVYKRIGMAVLVLGYKRLEGRSHGGPINLNLISKKNSGRSFEREIFRREY